MGAGKADARVYVAYARTLNALNAFSESRKAEERALELDPRSARAATELGVSHEGQGDAAGALRSFDEALAIDRDCFPAMLAQAWLYSTFDDPSYRDGKKARELATRALRIAERAAPEAVPEALIILAAALAECSEFVEACKTIGAVDPKYHNVNQMGIIVPHLESLFGRRIPYRRPMRAGR
jgi:tetratricopeptide (TPR) repeat protein